MKINRFTLAFVLIFLFASSTKLTAQTVAPKQLVGKWVIVDFSYKSAEHPDQDYAPSRKDFENMVKAKTSYEISENLLSERFINEVSNYVYKVEEGKLYYWNSAKLNGKVLLDDIVRNSTLTKKYLVSFESKRMVWTFKNSSYILRFTLQKQ